jgi:hypothetical protein
MIHEHQRGRYGQTDRGRVGASLPLLDVDRCLVGVATIRDATIERADRTLIDQLVHIGNLLCVIVDLKPCLGSRSSQRVARNVTALPGWAHGKRIRRDYHGLGEIEGGRCPSAVLCYTTDHDESAVAPDGKPRLGSYGYIFGGAAGGRVYLTILGKPELGESVGRPVPAREARQ